MPTMLPTFLSTCIGTQANVISTETPQDMMKAVKAKDAESIIVIGDDSNFEHTHQTTGEDPIFGLTPWFLPQLTRRYVAHVVQSLCAKVNMLKI